MVSWHGDPPFDNDGSSLHLFYKRQPPRSHPNKGDRLPTHSLSTLMICLKKPGRLSRRAENLATKVSMASIFPGWPTHWKKVLFLED